MALRTFIIIGFLGLATALTAQAQETARADWLRNPVIGNFKAYAEFKMANYAAARAVWETLAGIGNGEALFNLGMLAEDGLGEPRDLKKAEMLYAGAARAGNFKAQYRLGLLYSSGEVWPRDLDRARVYLNMAAAGGDRDAAALLASLGAPTTALTPFHQAEVLASSGRAAEAAALYERLARLAWMYEAGRGVPRDLPEAARRFERAAKAGDADAQYALAVMLRTGRGRARDLAESMAWLRRAAEQKHPAAAAALASDLAASEAQ